MTKPRKYQLAGVRMIQDFGGRALLADDMGLGKTYQTWLWIKKHLTRGPVLIVCPADLKHHWAREAKIHVGMKTKILSGMTPSEVKPKRKKNAIYIISYNLLGDPRKQTGTWLRWLEKIKFKLVVADEGHNISNRDAQRSKGFKELSRHAHHVIVLTGTPLTKEPAQIWHLLNCIRPDIYDSFYAFATKYCEPERTRWGWVYKGAKNLDKLHRRLKKQCMIRRLKKDVLDDLPPKTRTVVPMELDNRAEYDEAHKDFLKWLRKKSRRLGLVSRAIKWTKNKILRTKFKSEDNV